MKMKKFNDLSIDDINNGINHSQFMSDFKGIEEGLSPEFLSELTKMVIVHYNRGKAIWNKDLDLSEVIFASLNSSPCGCLGPTTYSKCGCSMEYYRYGYRFHIAQNIKENNIPYEVPYVEPPKDTELNESLTKIFALGIRA